MPKKDIKLSAEQELENLIQKLEDEYLFPYDYDPPNANSKEELSRHYFWNDEVHPSQHEIKRVKNFLKTPCKCGLSCQKLFQLDEVLNARQNFNLLSFQSKGCFLLPLLESFRVNLGCSKSARTTTQRKRQKYIYRINSNREVCREAFLFYYDIPFRSLKYFQHHLLEVGIIPPEHGNIRKTPYNAYSEADKNNIKLFLNNFATTHGLPDPGRNLRTGTAKLKIFLPSAMSYRYVHQLYLKSLPSEQNRVGYQSFIKIGQEKAPNVVFQKPRTDLCKTCEDHIKNIRIAIGCKKF